MIKAILTAAACCVLLGGCVAWGRGGDGFYPMLVQKPDPRYPNVFVYPPTIDRGGYAVVDQDPIVIRRGAKTTVSWAVDALSGYVFRDIEFRDPATGSRLETKDFCRESTGKTLDCTFEEKLFPTVLGTKQRKLSYTIRVGLKDSPKNDEKDITTDPGIWMVD